MSAILSKTLIAAACAILTGCSSRTSENLSSSNNWTIQHKSKQYIVDISISPAVASNNSMFVSLRSLTGEPISGALVSIKNIRQWLADTDSNLKAQSVGPGTYKIETNVREGVSEINLAIKPHNERAIDLRLETSLTR